MPTVTRRVALLVVVALLLLRLVRKAVQAAQSSFTKVHLNAADARMKRIIAAVGALNNSRSNPGYLPTWWCANMWTNVAVLVLKEKFTALLNPIPLRRQLISRPDGGVVALDWADDVLTKELPDEAPVLGILHTVCGNSSDFAYFIRQAAQRGWRAVVMVRRGHSGLALMSPNFCLIGNTDDTLAMLNTIQESYPASFIGLAGISAGSGQIVSFIGQQGAQLGPNIAAASLCPSYDITKSFHYLHDRFPLVDWFVTRETKSFFLNKPENKVALEQLPDAMQQTAAVNTLNGFFEAAVPYADGFFDKSNPMNFCTGNHVPCLVLNSEDDFLCVKENIQTDLVDKTRNYAIVVTERGSHCGYTEGTFGGGNFLCRVALDFFEAAKSDYIRYGISKV